MEVSKILIAMGYKPRVDFECYDDGDGPYIKFWHHSDPKPSSDQLKLAWNESKLDITKEEIVAKVKFLAGKKILKICPEWKQRNLIAKSVALQRKEVKGKATTEDLDELNSIEANWQKIEDIIGASNTIEAEINKLKSLKKLNAYTVADNPNWP